MTVRTKVKQALAEGEPGAEYLVKGWARTVRNGKGVTFISLNDGSSLSGIQVVAEPDLANYAELTSLGTGAAIAVTGLLEESPAAGQALELKALAVEIVGAADQDYPMQKKRHSFEYLRSIAHLRPRTNTFGAVFRVRSSLAQEVHRFFGERGFLYVHTPIITANDCEGAGELFRVTTLDLAHPPLGATARSISATTSSARRPASRSAASSKVNSLPWPFPTSTPSAPPSAPRTPTRRATRPNSG